MLVQTFLANFVLLETLLLDAVILLVVATGRSVVRWNSDAVGVKRFRLIDGAR